MKQKDTITISVSIEMRQKFRENCDKFDLGMSAVLKETIRRFNLLVEEGSRDPWIELYGGSTGRGLRSKVSDAGGSGGGRIENGRRETVSQSSKVVEVVKEPRLTAEERRVKMIQDHKLAQAKKTWEFNPIPIGEVRVVDDAERLRLEEYWRANRADEISDLTIFDLAIYYDEANHLYNEGLDGLVKGRWGAMHRGDAVWVFEALKEKNPLVYVSEFWDRRFMRMGNEANWVEFKKYFPTCKEAYIEYLDNEKSIKKTGVGY